MFTGDIKSIFRYCLSFIANIASKSHWKKQSFPLKIMFPLTEVVNNKIV